MEAPVKKRGRPKKQLGPHPLILVINRRLEERNITKTELACQLLDLMDSPKPCNRSWKSNCYRLLSGNVTPGERVRAAMVAWLERNP